MKNTPHGTLEIITGPMFSGKTNALIRKIKKAKVETQLFKPAHDTRYEKNMIVSHDGKKISAITVRTAKEILKHLAPRTALIAIDEGQFFGPQLIPVVHALLATGKNVVISGLSITYDKKPFPPLPNLMTEAEKVTKLTAKCANCERPAAFHTRTASITSKNHLDDSFIGGAESYKPLCRSCIKK